MRTKSDLQSLSLIFFHSYQSSRPFIGLQQATIQCEFLNFELLQPVKSSLKIYRHELQLLLLVGRSFTSKFLDSHVWSVHSTDVSIYHLKLHFILCVGMCVYQCKMIIIWLVHFIIHTNIIMTQNQILFLKIHLVLDTGICKFLWKIWKGNIIVIRQRNNQCCVDFDLTGYHRNKSMTSITIVCHKVSMCYKSLRFTNPSLHMQQRVKIAYFMTILISIFIHLQHQTFNSYRKCSVRSDLKFDKCNSLDCFSEGL